MKNFFVSLRLLLAFTLILGMLYPMLIWSVGHVFHSREAEGSLVLENGAVKGSALIAQKFVQLRYFWPRPSATQYSSYPSGGSHLFWSSAALVEGVGSRLRYLQAVHRLSATETVPPELLYASASGLDPHISLDAAVFQASRVARARGLGDHQHAQLNQLILSNLENKSLGFIGQERVNVFLLNLAMDRQFP